MSEDPTRPLPGWGPRGQSPRDQSPRGPQSWDHPSQETGRLPGGGYPSPGAGYRTGQEHAGRDYRGQDHAGGGYGPARRRGRARRRLTVATIVVVVLLALLVAVDRGAAAYAENQAASQIKSSGFPVKPSVTIEGFPFLTQVLAHDLKTVNISASNVPEGPLVISSVNATAHGVHLNSSFSGGTIGQVNGTALVTFAGLSQAAGVGDGVTLSNAGNNEVKVSANLGFLNGSVLARVTRTGPHTINVSAVAPNNQALSGLGPLQNFNLSVPSLPAGMTVRNVSVTGQGLVITVSASNTGFSR